MYGYLTRMEVQSNPSAVSPTEYAAQLSAFLGVTVAPPNTALMNERVRFTTVLKYMNGAQTTEEEDRRFYAAASQIKRLITDSNVLQIPEADRYYTFTIPKRTGGVRTITAPHPQVKEIQRQVKNLLWWGWQAYPHNAAYAYIPKRSTLDAIRVHQQNKSKWFVKLDLKDFFPSCTWDAVIQALMHQTTHHAMYNYIDLNNIAMLACYEGALPQGTPLSPMLSNLIAKPMDVFITERLPAGVVYTRYADDMLFSSPEPMITQQYISVVNKAIADQHLPFKINEEKTRYGSNAGSNWNLGYMLNKDNNITTGYKNKQRLRAAIYNFMTAFTNQTPWSKIDSQALLGDLEYTRHAEPEWTKEMLQRYSTKFNTDVYVVLLSCVK